MKTINKTFRLAILILFLSPLAQVMAQPGPPPGGAGGSDEPIGGNAPIGSGLIILTALGLVYGGKKLYDLHKEAKED